MRWNNKVFPLLNIIDGKKFPYVSKGILRHYHYRSDQKLGPGIVAIIRISCSCHDCTKISSLSWDYRIKNLLISLYTEEFIIANTLKFLVVTIIGFNIYI